MALADRAAVPDPREAQRRIEALINVLEGAGDQPAAESARELVSTLLDMHGEGLAAIMSILSSSAGGEVIIAKLDGDESVRALMLLHGIHPENTETRVRRVIERLRPHLGVEGVRVEVAEVASGAARLRITYSAGSLGAARRLMLPVEIEQLVLDAAPEIQQVVISEVDQAQAESVTS